MVCGATDCVGMIVGCNDGAVLGLHDGETDGENVGNCDGIAVGETVSPALVGANEGTIVGF